MSHGARSLGQIRAAGSGTCGRAITGLCVLALVLLALPALGGPPALASAPAPAPVTGRELPPGSVALTGAGPSPVSATFGIGPATPSAPDQRPYFNYLVQPGSSLAPDDVAVVNVGTLPLSLSVYTTDVVNGPHASSAFPPAGAPISDAGAWISLQIPGHSVTVTVAARSYVIVPIRITIPKNAAPGDHAAGIIASLDTVAKNASGELVHFNQRVATRAFFRVSGALKPRLQVSNFSATYHQNYLPGDTGRVTLRYTVANAGNIKLGVSQRVTFDGLLGSTKVARAPADIPLLLPGGSAQYTIQVHGVLPELLGTAHVTLTPRAVLGDVDPPLAPTDSTKRVWTLPLTLLLVLLLAVGAGVAWKRRGRPSPGGLPAGSGAAVDVVEQVGS